MTPDLTNAEQRIDRDKREREKEIALLLLALFGLARQQTLYAVKVGADPFQATSGALLGNRILNLPGGTARLANEMRLADAAGFRRTLLMLPGETLYQPGLNYLSIAGQALAQMLGTLQRRIAVAMMRSGGVMRNTVDAIRETFRVGGYVRENPYALETAAENLVGQAYGAGYLSGLNRPGLNLSGFRYSALLDDRTTPICRAYDRVQLPRNHPWWLSHWPLNHWRCRSVVLPIVGSFEATANPPYEPPPMAGFGRAPFASLAAA